MPARDEQTRLSEIETRWSLLMGAAHGPAESAAEARKLLLLRYHRAAYRYLLGAVRDPDAAGELAQELALWFLRGDFRRADPDRGRFRDYLKATLIHLVAAHHRRRGDGPGPLPSEVPAPDEPRDGAGPDFLDGWRAELIERATATLAESHPIQHAALVSRIQDPSASSGELADHLAAELGRPMRADRVRKALQRARDRLAELLVDEVARSMGPDPGISLEQELRELNLLSYCQPALDRRAGR